MRFRATTASTGINLRPLLLKSSAPTGCQRSTRPSGQLGLDEPGTLSTRKGADDVEARDHQPARTGERAVSAAAVPMGLPEVSPSVGWRWVPRHPGTAG